VTRFGLRDRVRRLPAGEVIVRASVFVVGLALIVTGLALSVLPGPLTIPPVVLGLLVWSLEFEFAQRWLHRFEAPAQQAWEQAKARPVRTAVVSGGGLLATVVLTVVAVQQDWVGSLLRAAKGVFT
jgi:uncharacterized membrane protein YbaN (DUF454 family)